MANLRVNKITGTEVFETTGSVQFSGNSRLLVIPSSALTNPAFNVEAYVYFTGSTSSGDYTVFDFSNAADGYGMYGAVNSGTFGFNFYSTNASTPFWRISSSFTSYLNRWVHIATSFDGNTYRAFFDGVLVGSVSSTTQVVSLNRLTIGARSDSASPVQPWLGHISNFRYINGTALYTKNFTPPTRELTVIPNTVLLCCQSTTRANEERTGKTITVNGNAVANELTPGLLTDRIRSGGSSAISGSVEFDGDGDYLTAGTSNDYIFGTGDYTLECWAYFSTLNSENSLVSTHNGDANWTWKVVSNKLRIYTGTTDVDGTSTITTGSWFHFAVSRQSSTLRLFVNGINETTTTSSNNYTINNILHIGAQQNNLAGSYLKGFISNLRVIKGTALYTQNFIPPTRELKNLPGTVLLCCQNSKSATQEATGKTITVNGNATARYFTPPVGFDGFVNFDGVTKIKSPNYFYLPTGTTEDRGRGRGLFGGGESVTNVIEYIQIQSQGNAIDFGDLTQQKRFAVACSSSTRGVFGGGGTGPGNTLSNVLEFITISTTGNSITFGSLIAPTHRSSSCSSSTRGLFAGGYSPATPTLSNAIDYITIASIGNSQDFGDLTIARFGPGALASSTRGVFFGGSIPPTFQNRIDYVTIASTGNAVTFGNISVGGIREVCGCASAVRGVYGSGYDPSTNFSNVLEYITIASTGNGTDFGDLTQGRTEVYASTSNSIRGVWAGGQIPSTVTNTIDYITISSTGNAQDFGDLTVARSGVGACSDSHGGLG